MSPRQFFSVAKESIKKWQADYASSMGAAIAFYTIFSIAPLLIIVIAVAGFVWGEDAVRGDIMRELAGLLGEEGAAGVQSLLKSANKPGQGVTATMISIAVLAVGATRVFAELQSALDRIWKVSGTVVKKGIWTTVRARLLSFGLVLGLAFLLLVSMVIGTALAAFGQWVYGLFPGWEYVMMGLNALAALVTSVVLFAMIFKFMPQIHVAWRDVWTGALVTGVLFEIGKLLIGLYVAKSASISSLTAAGSVVVVLIWVYYAAQVFLLGAEFTWCYATRHGSLRSATAKDAHSSLPA